jgi:hypothetical protein
MSKARQTFRRNEVMRAIKAVRDAGLSVSDQLAGELGFEPRFSESESDVLPLNYSPMPRT